MTAEKNDLICEPEINSIIPDHNSQCPVCDKLFPSNEIETHVNRCLFLTSSTSKLEGCNSRNSNETTKRNFKIFGGIKNSEPLTKKIKLNHSIESFASQIPIDISDDEGDMKSDNNILIKGGKKNCEVMLLDIPLAEKMRPNSIDDFVGQIHIIKKNTVLRSALDSNEIPSMIFWGPPGCGKTTLANIISNKCKATQNCRFVKLSATMVGINDVKEIVKKAKNELSFKRKTILFMDEIHRFNKLQQDTFLPHVESGTIILIGATTENPSFSLNSALLSRCRVIVLEKLTSENLYKILERALRFYNILIIDGGKKEQIAIPNFSPTMAIDNNSVQWLSDICDGDGRIALNTLQLVMQTIQEQQQTINELNGPLKLISIESLKEGIKKSHLLYDRKGDQHFDCISALHKSIRASHENAALYWCTRMLEGGENPLYICRRLVRLASEDIGISDPHALQIALSTYQSVQLIGMPESDCIIAQCVVYLARASKSREICDALSKCKESIKNHKGPIPSVPLHLRNAPTKLMKEIGFGAGYNMLDKDESGLEYMPEGMEDVNYFED